MQLTDEHFHSSNRVAEIRSGQGQLHAPSNGARRAATSDAGHVFKNQHSAQFSGEMDFESGLDAGGSVRLGCNEREQVTSPSERIDEAWSQTNRREWKEQDHNPTEPRNPQEQAGKDEGLTGGRVVVQKIRGHAIDRDG